MKRLFILVSDLKETSEVAEELKSLGVKENQIHICGGISEEVKDLHLHPASVFQTTNLAYSVKFGPIVGLGFVVFMVILCGIFFPPSIKIGALGYVAIFVFGIGFGIWSAGLIGLGVKNSVIEKYEKFLKKGHYIMMVDNALLEKETKITEAILLHHPRVKIANEMPPY